MKDLKIFGFCLKDKSGWTADPKYVKVFAKTEKEAATFLREGYKENHWEIMYSCVAREKITEGDYI